MVKTIHDSETPAKGLQVITACAFIHQKFEETEKVFMAKRADSKKFLPGVYELPGGHINFGEDIIVGLKREILEELNMAITVGDPFNCFTYTNEVKGSHSIEVLFFAQFSSPLTDLKLDPESHSEYGWFSKEEFTKSVISNKKNANDPEFTAVYKAFDLLEGKPLNT